MKHKRKNVKLFFIKIKNSSCLKLTVRKIQGKASGQDDFFIKHGQNYNKYMQFNKKNAGTQLKMDKNEQKTPGEKHWETLLAIKSQKYFFGFVS